MLAATLLTLALASTVLSAPNDRQKRCDISKAKIQYPANQAPLPAPASPPSYIAVAIGTQNYTCGSTGTYAATGAVAELFDVGCLYGTPLFNQIENIAYGLWKALPPTVTPQTIITGLSSIDNVGALGQHYYTKTATGSLPKWDFTSTGQTKGNKDAYVIAAKTTGFPSPEGTSNVDWVLLTATEGKLAKQVYRVDTLGGQPPASCTPGQSTTVKYASKYWLHGSTL